MYKDNAYQGHETWWNAFRMSLKMYSFIFMYSFAVHIVIFVIVSKLYMPEGSMKFGTEYMLYMVRRLLNPLILVQDADLREAFYSLLWRLFAFFLASGIPIYVLTYPLMMGYFKKRAREQSIGKYIRGALLISPEELTENMKINKDEPDLPVGPVKLPQRRRGQTPAFYRRSGNRQNQPVKPDDRAAC